MSQPPETGVARYEKIIAEKVAALMETNKFSAADGHG
jgi:hypothetical protein